MPNRSASDLLNVLRDIVPAEVTNSLQHLRRFAKPEFLPRHLRCIDHGRDDVDVSKPSEEEVLSPREAKSTTSHVLVCLTCSVSLSTLEHLFKDHVELFSPLEPSIREVSVPVFAPTSATQAAEWSEKYWPTIYKNTNPYGPHPAFVRRAELELVAGSDVDQYMDLARYVATENACRNVGIEVGTVIVERVSGTKKARVVSVAGDARYTGLHGNDNSTLSSGDSRASPRNMMGHAALRAISMVAQKRRVIAQLIDEAAATRNENPNLGQPAMDAEPEPFASSPLCDLEGQYVTASDNLSPNGYLCLDLEIYLTHEPCVMCAMAILHSRFSRVVFEKRMPNTGALCAEDTSLGHGLFWREQLNWKFLAWQWQPSSPSEEEGGICEDDFHA